MSAEIQKYIAEISNSFSLISRRIQFETLKDRISSKTLECENPDIWKDQSLAKALMRERQDLLEKLQPYALGNIDLDPVMLPNDIEDLFFLSGWARPELYLEESVRFGMSHFAKAMQSSEKNKMVNDAIIKLKNDLDTGSWSDRFGREVTNMKNYDGGYRIVSFVKK